MLCDPAFELPPGDRHGSSFRAVAIAPDIRRGLERLGIWTQLTGRVQAVTSMVITDGRSGLLPNPVFVTFGEDETGAEPLAHMVFTDDLRRELVEACETVGVVFEPCAARGLREEPWCVNLELSDGSRRRTRLLAAADGGQSRLRHAARCQVLEWSYPQAAIVATLGHTEDHRGRATQHFLPSGPIALLPLRADDGSGRRLSLVWTATRAEAARLATLPPALFCAALEERVGLELGPLTLEDQPRAHPLHMRVARRQAIGRLALIGDAARVIHPLAGQGLNLGLRDAEALARHAGAAGQLGLDPGARRVLDAFERERRPDSAFMAAGTDLLDRLFSTDLTAVRSVRDFGLGLVDRVPALKRGFAKWAGAAP